MRAQNLVAIARAELRLTRRLVRYWVFLALSYLIGLGGYFYYGALHAFFSSYSATVASIGPRYLIGAVGQNYLLVFMVGLVFLGFDLRSRDRRERVDEVLDSRPFTNLELVAGRFSGLLVAAWVPVVLLASLLQGLGYLLPALGSPVGGPMEPVSLVAFVTVMALPAFAFTLGLTFLVTLVVRNRLIAAIVALAALGGLFFALLRLPIRFTPLLDVTGAYAISFPSELVPAVADTVGWVQRLAVLAAALGLVGLAAALHPRLDGGARWRGLVGGGAVLAVALLAMGAGVASRSATLERLEAWRSVHQARAGDAGPDLVTVAGVATVNPGRRLELELDLTLRAPEGTPLTSLLFTLNPGLEVARVELGSAGEAAFSEHDGLLEIERPTALEGGATETVHLVAAGRLDTRFAYLDASRVPEAVSPWEGQIFLLGYERAIDDRRYVALMPGVHWLPAPGADVGRDDPRTRPRDYFDLDLTVDLPEGWLVAGPGRRREVEGGDGRVRYRFAPGAPVPEVALVASRFASRSLELDGRLFEILVDPAHADNFEVLADAREEVRTWLAERLEAAAAAGLSYPYDGLTIVEVPTVLRGFAGGWRLDTALAAPGVVLMRESGFPTARFDVPFRHPERFQEREGGLPRAKRERLVLFSLNDFSGGNVLGNAARSFFVDQTSARGRGAIALDFVLEELTELVLTDTRGYFSAHVFTPELNQAVGAALQSYFRSTRRDGNVAAAVIDAFTSRPEVWSSVLGVSLADLDPNDDPRRTIDVLTLKGGALARSLYDELGAEKVGRLLATLRTRYTGTTFTLADLERVAAEEGEELGGLFEDWLTATDLPGFVAEEAEAYRLSDGPDGASRYQLALTLRNDERVPGVLRVGYLVGQGDDREREESEPIRVAGHSAVRFAVVLTRPPLRAWVEPYLSLNREPFRVALPEIDEERPRDAAPLAGVASVAWAPPNEGEIVVDDLDGGFSVAGGLEHKGVRIGARSVEGELDDGLPVPVPGRLPATWSRATNPSAWGRYRHTLAFVRAGDGAQQAVFTTPIPRSGAWELDLHLPDRRRFRRSRRWGSWRLEVADASGSRSLELDAAAASAGWNLVDTVELEAGEVTVSLSDESDGQLVVADAIRWSQTTAGGNAEEAAQ